MVSKKFHTLLYILFYNPNYIKFKSMYEFFLNYSSSLICINFYFHILILINGEYNYILKKIKINLKIYLIIKLNAIYIMSEL
jgi:hypothetical protein